MYPRTNSSRPADRVWAGHRTPAPRPRHQDPRRRRPDGSVRAVLPARAGASVVGYVTQAVASRFTATTAQPAHAFGDEERRVEIDWREVEGETFVVRLAVSGEDRRGLYADICEAISGTGPTSAVPSSRRRTASSSAQCWWRSRITPSAQGPEGGPQGEGCNEIARRDSSVPLKSSSVSFPSYAF